MLQTCALQAILASNAEGKGLDVELAASGFGQHHQEVMLMPIPPPLPTPSRLLTPTPPSLMHLHLPQSLPPSEYVAASHSCPTFCASRPSLMHITPALHQRDAAHVESAQGKQCLIALVQHIVLLYMLHYTAYSCVHSYMLNQWPDLKNIKQENGCPVSWMRKNRIECASCIMAL